MEFGEADNPRSLAAWLLHGVAAGVAAVAVWLVARALDVPTYGYAGRFLGGIFIITYFMMLILLFAFGPAVVASFRRQQ